jgi:hypothetical protein
MSTVCNEAFFLAIQSGVVAHAEGLPGIAKTETIKCFAQAAKRKCYILIGSLREPADIGGYPFPVDVAASEKVMDAAGKHVGYIALLAPKWAADACDGDKWLIVFDEITTCPPAVQAAMLRVLAEKVVGDTPLPKDTWMCALSNPSGIAANGFELEPPMANRMVHFKWEIDWDAWEDGISNSLQFPDPKFRLVPEGWEERIGPMGAMIAAFRKHKPDCFTPPTDSSGAVTLERAKLAGPWPSPRSWTLALTCLAAADAAGASKMVRSQLLHGAVGFAVASEFETWMENLDLPDPETELAAAVKALDAGKKVAAPKVDRPDKVIAFIAAISDRVVGNKNDTNRYNGPRWSAAMAILERLAEKHVDVALSQARRLAINKPADATFTDTFKTNFYPIIFKAMDKASK